MESVTKHKQTRETIGAMVSKAFPGLGAARIAELKEGFFNAAYSVELSDGRETVLKIAPPTDAVIMTHEQDIMLSEVEALRLVAERTNVPVPSVLFYGRGNDGFGSDYFFAEKLRGRSYNSMRAELGDAARAAIDRQVGQLNARINVITGERFGYFGQPQRQGRVWIDVFRSILQDAVRDAERRDIALPVDFQTLAALLDRDAPHFAEVAEPRLVHWDLWSGNVFVEYGRVTGLIDFERCLWAEPLMEAGFRAINVNSSFLEGYGMGALSVSESARSRWYDMYLYLISALECDYRKYPDRGVYDWAVRMIGECQAAIETGTA
ncbi:phosphotransferase family protein [Paenibacillus soyae]|uniref:Aminoglycoside phosphotransferase family protein n=1 Tax=Paenibacillus soyae TaxID=2969249 RepID=A0A9X2S7V4_9BACL|nr:aminoglycoside phosphotransferase family protein [Paenibacillus soyae]MCR2803540.1 aminoglycoside phosphotransferase family protein [Paenibacillus soyae]